MDKIISFLFTDPVSAGANTTSGNPEVFHFYLPWIIFCALGLIIPFYYAVEGRKRFFGSHTVNKWVADKMMNHLWPLALVGFALIGARYALNGSLFSWRIWRYGWLAWGVVLIAYWSYFFIARYDKMLKSYRAYRVKAQYHPQPNSKRRTVRANSR